MNRLLNKLQMALKCFIIVIIALQMGGVMAGPRLFDSKPSNNYLKQVFEIDFQFPLEERLLELEQDKPRFEYGVALKELKEAKKKIANLDHNLDDNPNAPPSFRKSLEEDLDKVENLKDALEITLSEKEKNYFDKYGKTPELFTEKMEQYCDTLFQEYRQLTKQKKYFSKKYNSLNKGLQTNVDMKLISSFTFLPLIQTALADIQTNFNKLLNLPIQESEKDLHTKLDAQFTNLMSLIELIQKIQKTDSDAFLHLSTFQLDSNENLKQLLNPLFTAQRLFTADDQKTVEDLLMSIIQKEKLHGPGVTFHEDEPDPTHVTFHRQKR